MARPQPTEGRQMTSLLELRGVTKKFGPNTVLDDVDITVAPNEVVGLIGENGAGKSTLLKILAGVHRPDGGEMMLGGTPVSFSSPADAAGHGIGVVHQEQSLLPNLTVGQNLMLGHEGDCVRAGFLQRRRMRARAKDMLSVVESTVDPRTRTENLSFAQRQMVEVARAVGGPQVEHAPLLILDEPTSVLEPEDVEVLHRRVTALKERGSVIFVSHRLDEVLRFSDRVYVLRDGKVVGERISSAATESELYELMIGKGAAEEIYSSERKRAVTQSDIPVLSVRGVSCAGKATDVSFDIQAGEILSVVGVVDSGREEVARAIFGAIPISSGTVKIDGSTASPGSPADAVRSGVAYVPSDRRVEGMIAGATVAENIAAVHPVKAAGGRVSSRAHLENTARTWIDNLNIRPPDPHADIARLSGGNQQKAVVAKWILGDGLRLLILDHPTRGLDIGAKEDLYALFRDLSDQGVAILVLADTLDEAIGLGHRVLVMRDGEITGVFDSPNGNPPSKLQLLEKMM
ncbi:sugar ABC transporter ATP-binding protein [Rhodococcus aetherivorans]|uniref:sugar ABC transporter ATP-binding protein n=2 Tax=Rhodococcus aetherivorans TaxID=191292 RepID=UPI002E11D283